VKYADEISELVYQDYQVIGPKDHQERIRFYEHNREDIVKLPFKKRLEISLEYTVSLFEVGEYYQYLKHVDKLLHIAIEENLFSLDGDDIYQELLFRKACSLHNIVDYHAADHVFSELIRIDNNNKVYQQAYKKNKVSHLRYLGQRSRTITILLLFLTGILIGVELLIVRPFFAEQAEIFQWVRMSVFGVALAGIIVQEIAIRFLASANIRKMIKKS